MATAISYRDAAGGLVEVREHLFTYPCQIPAATMGLLASAPVKFLACNWTGLIGFIGIGSGGSLHYHFLCYSDPSLLPVLYPLKILVCIVCEPHQQQYCLQGWLFGVITKLLTIQGLFLSLLTYFCLIYCSTKKTHLTLMWDWEGDKELLIWDSWTAQLSLSQHPCSPNYIMPFADKLNVSLIWSG